MPIPREADLVALPRLTAQQAVTTEAGSALDHLVGRDALGWEWLPYPKGYWQTAPGEGHGQTPLLFSTRIQDAWQVVEFMVVRMGYDDLQFGWSGPVFKSEQYYLSMPGYGLGSTCWYVAITNQGWAHAIPAPTPSLAICRAALVVAAIDWDAGTAWSGIDWHAVAKRDE